MALPQIPENPSARQLGEALLSAADDIARIRSLPEDQRNSAEVAQEAKHLRQFVTDLDAEHTARSAAERATYVPQSTGPTVALDAPEQRERSLGEMVVEDEGFQNFVRSGQVSNGSHTMNLERTLVTTTTATLWEPTQTPAAPVPVTRRLFVRDLISRVQVTGNSLTIMQESNTGTNELLANVVAEGAAKPEVALTWTSVTVPIRKIAAWIPLTTEIIEDAPALRGYIDNRLLYMLKLREEIEFLAGDGTGAHILGITNQTGLQTQAAVEADVPATIGRAISKIEVVDGEADGVAMHPTDFWLGLTTRHANIFDNGFGGNAPASASSITWGLPVIRTRGVDAGTCIVGAWRQGATVLDRSGAQIEVGNQHASYFVENKVAVRAEERVGLAVDKPSYFVETTLDHVVGV